MRNEQSPFLQVLGAIDLVRGAIGYMVLLGITLAFLIMGNTPGRLIGVALLAVCLFIAIRIFRRASRRA